MLEEQTDIIQIIKTLSDEENIKISSFIAGMQAQKNIELQLLEQSEGVISKAVISEKSL